MKKLKNIYAFAAAMLMFCSCSNDFPEFNDADAFVAFNKSSVSVTEDGEQVVIPVTLSSLSGIAADVNYKVTEISAKEGVHFTIEGEKVLHFTKENPVQNIVVKVIDDDVFGGNVKFNITLEESSVNLGAASECGVTIEDDEHPLKFILADYAGSVVDLWGSAYTFNWSIKRDETDLSKVWLEGFAPKYGQGTFDSVYGVVSDDHKTISIPAGQPLLVNSNYNIKLWVGDDDDPGLDGEIYDSGHDLIGDISDDGKTIVLRQGWAAYDPDNGAFEAYPAGMTVTKK